MKVKVVEVETWKRRSHYAFRGSLRQEYILKGEYYLTFKTIINIIVMNMCIMLRQIAICFTHGPSNISVTHIFFMLNAYGALLVNISTLLQPLNYLCIMGDTHVFQHFHYFLPLLSTPISRESLLNYSCTTCVLHVFPRRIEARFVSLYTKF